MRRKDREVTAADAIEKIISECHCCRIGFNDKGRVYIVPMNFGYEKTQTGYVFYFHSAKEGRKIDLINSNPLVGFELDTGYELVQPSELACDCTARFKSVIGNGVITFAADREEKIKGLTSIMLHNTGKIYNEYSEKMLDAVCVFKLTAESLSCKEHL